MLNTELIEKLKTAEIPPQAHMIGGRPVASLNGQVLEVLSPRDGCVLTTIAAGGSDEIDLAVAAARQSFEQGSWAAMPPAERKKVLVRLAELIETHAYELAVLGVRDNSPRRCPACPCRSWRCHPVRKRVRRWTGTSQNASGAAPV